LKKSGEAKKSGYLVGLELERRFLLRNQLIILRKRVSISGGVGERTREGNDLYMEMKESKVINEQNRIKGGSGLWSDE